MENLPHAKMFQQLVVYQKSKELALLIFEISKSFPPQELYSLTNQIRRSSRSIGAQIAESWAKRLYKKHFVSKLTDADAELHETEHWVETAYLCGYVELEQKEQLIQDCSEIGRMIGSMIKNAEKFCSGQRIDITLN
jgi:four helix bundle protein